MPLKLAEGLIDEVKAYLVANLAAKLTALDTEYADGITLTEPAIAFYVGERSLDAIPQYPAVFILAEQTTVESWHAAFTDASHRFIVGAFILDQDSETLGRRLYRWGRAFWELLVEARGDGGLTYHLVDVPIEIDFSPIGRQGPSGPFLAGLQVSASARKQETKP